MYQSLQGNVGLGKAIEYFTSHKIPVSIPLNDTQPYDLIADIDGKLQKIQTKTSRYSETNGRTYIVQLKNSGGNRTGTTRIVPFDNTSCDYVFVYTESNKTYLIPSDKINTTSTITVGVKYSEYEVSSNTLKDFIEDFKN